MSADDVNAKFGAALRARRIELGLTQDGLSELCGLDRTYIGGVERGERNPTLKSVATIAEALRCTVADLLRGV